MFNIQLLPITIMVAQAMILLPFNFYALMLCDLMLMRMEDEESCIPVFYYKIGDLLTLLVFFNSGCISIPFFTSILKLIKFYLL